MRLRLAVIALTVCGCVFISGSAQVIDLAVPEVRSTITRIDLDQMTLIVSIPRLDASGAVVDTVDVTVSIAEIPLASQDEFKQIGVKLLRFRGIIP